MVSINKEPVFAWLRLNGTASGSKDMTVVASASGSKVFAFIAPAGERTVIERLNIQIIDASIQWGKFGGLSALTNGIKVEHVRASGAVLEDYFDGETIKTNEDWAALAGSDVISSNAAGDDAIKVRWTLSRVGTPLVMEGGTEFRLTLQDSCTGLTKFQAMVQGHLF